MNSVYLILSSDDNTYKIGVSKHPKKRLLALQTGNPSKLKLITSFDSDFAFKIETVLHRRYSFLRKEGEWFELSLENENEFIDECKKLEENFIYLKSSGNVFI